MVSRLFRVLNNVEATRLNLINVLKNKGIVIDKDTNFSNIIAEVDALTPTVVESPDIPYYDNPDDDPCVWKCPTDWPDIETILKSKRSYFRTINNVEYELYPFGIILYTTERDTISFRLQASQSALGTIADGILIVGTPYTSTKGTAGCYFSLETNEGTFIDFQPTTGTQTIEHTFDNSKDIITDSGARYKYVILYQSIRKLSVTTSLTSSARNGLLYYYTLRHGADIESLASVYNTIFVPTSGVAYTSYTSSRTICTMQYAKYDCDGYYYTPVENDGTKDYNMLYYNSIPQFGNYQASLKRLEVFIKKSAPMKFWENLIMFPVNNSVMGMPLEVFKTNAKFLFHNSTSSNGYGTFGTLVYYDAPTFIPGFFYTSNVTTYTLKYLRGVDYDAMCTLYDTYEANYSGFGVSVQFRILEDYTMLTRFMKALSNGAFKDCFRDTDDLVFDKLLSYSMGYFLGMNHCRSMVFNKVSSTNPSILLSLNCDKAYFPMITTFSKSFVIFQNSSTQYYGLIPKIKELYLPNLVTITDAIFTDYNYYSMPTELLDVSNLRELGTATAFACFSNLKTLILGEDFKFNLNLGALVKLSEDCIKDILNKCAPLSEEESFTITLDTIFKNSITETEEYTKAIEKGWTVTFS